jgi:hypothetical protein
MAGRGEESSGATDSRTALEQALQNLQTAVAVSGAEIHCGNLPALPVAEAHLVQLFQNLIGNAIQYRGAGAPEIRIPAKLLHGEWVFSVRDNGMGIPPEFHKQIFGLFKRLHGREIPGTGMGLAMCQKIAERYGGRIWVESETGHGAEFFFALPATLATAANETSRHDPPLRLMWAAPLPSDSAANPGARGSRSLHGPAGEQSLCAPPRYRTDAPLLVSLRVAPAAAVAGRLGALALIRRAAAVARSAMAGSAAVRLGVHLHISCVVVMSASAALSNGLTDDPEKPYSAFSSLVLA